MDSLTPRNKDFSTYAGVFGCLLSLTCLFQFLLLITSLHWLATLFPVIYIYSAVSFIFLAVHRNPGPILLIINSVLFLLASFLSTKSGLFSPVLVVTFIYTVIIVVVTYMDKLPAKFREKALAVKAEREMWMDKI